MGIGTFHEKVNLLLKEKGLKQVGDNPNAPKADAPNPVNKHDNLLDSNIDKTEQPKLVDTIPTIHEEFDLPFELPSDLLDTIIKIGQQIGNEEPVENQTEIYKCEVCMVELQTKQALMEHYSG